MMKKTAHPAFRIRLSQTMHAHRPGGGFPGTDAGDRRMCRKVFFRHHETSCRARFHLPEAFLPAP